MIKLIETPEAGTYGTEIRARIVRLAEIQLLFEWRYWILSTLFILVASVVTGVVECLGLRLIAEIGVTVLVLFPVGLLWMYLSWRMIRWVLSHRRKELLHALGMEDLDPVETDKEPTPNPDPGE